MRMMAMFDEFTEFVKSSEYNDMPNEHELNNEEESEHQHKRKFKRNKFLQNYEMQNREIKDAYLHLFNTSQTASNSQNNNYSEMPSLSKSKENRVYG